MAHRGMDIDTRQHPIVLVRYLTAALTDDDVTYFRERMDSVLHKAQPFVTIIDTARLTRMPAARIMRALERWVDDNEAAVREFSCGTATIAKSMLARGVARWALHQRRVKTDGTAVATLREAADWAVAQLKKRGVATDPGLMAQLLLDEPTGQAIVSRRGDVDVDQLAQIEMVLGAFAEPAFLVDPDGKVLFENAAATLAFESTPGWLQAAVHTGHDGIKELCRVVPLDLGADLMLVVPTADLVPAGEPDAAPLALPESLRKVAVLLAQGLSDKEISAHTQLSLSSVRTYVTRIFKRTQVHSRGAFIRAYARQLMPPRGEDP